jgi:RNA polymerase sigma-70 factor, ECF subfamily
VASGSSGSSPPTELIDAASRGDEEAFRRLVGTYRTELHAHCYRMLGSIHDADDAFQEMLVRAWRGLPQFSGPRLVRPWLYRIATNVCLDTLARQARRGLPIDHGAPAGRDEALGDPVAEPVWVEPYPDQRLGLPDGYTAPEARYEQREAVELAFIAALQHLPATQRAVLILRDVLGFSARETADSLETTVASVNSALQRARKTAGERIPARSQQATLRALGDPQVREIVERYIEAWERGDVDAIAALLADDAIFSMPPYPMWWRGGAVIAAFGAEPVHRYVATRANGQLASAAYRWDPATGAYVAEALEILTFEGARVKQMTAFMTPEIFPRFGLPAELPQR